MSMPDPNRPTIEQVAWVFRHLADVVDTVVEKGQPVSFRALIRRMGFGNEAYLALHDAGGQYVLNALNCVDKEELRRCYT